VLAATNVGAHESAGTKDISTNKRVDLRWLGLQAGVTGSSRAAPLIVGSPVVTCKCKCWT